MSNRAAYGYRSGPFTGFLGRIWRPLELRKIFHMGVQIGISDRSARARPVVSSPFIIPHWARAVNRQNEQKLRVDFSTLNF